LFSPSFTRIGYPSEQPSIERRIASNSAGLEHMDPYCLTSPDGAFKSIPSEIKTAIFYQCWEPLADISLVHRALAVIQSVSRDWRRIALGSPVLWAEFTVFPFGPDKTQSAEPNLVAMLQRSLARSRSCPLHFEVIFKSRSAHADLVSVYAALDLLSSHVERWEYVHLEIDTDSCSRLFRDNAIDRATALREFTMSLDTLCRRESPALVLFNPFIPWGRLTGLRATYSVSIQSTIRILWQCPQLRWLEIAVHLTPADPTLIIPLPIGHSLRVLSLMISAGPSSAATASLDFTWFLSQLEICSLALERLTMSWPEWNGDSPRSMQFLHSQRKTLLSLEMFGFDIDEQMVECLRALPKLHNLRISPPITGSSFNKPLFHLLRSKECSLKLKHLEIRGCLPTYNAQDILEFLQEMSVRPGVVEKFVFRTIKLHSVEGIELSGCEPYLSVWRERGLLVDLRAHGWTEESSYRYSNIAN